MTIEHSDVKSEEKEGRTMKKSEKPANPEGVIDWKGIIGSVIVAAVLVGIAWLCGLRPNP